MTHLRVLAFFFVSACGFSYVCAQPACPFLAGALAQPEPGLTYCTEYKALSCCSNTSEQALQQNLESKVETLYGDYGCYATLKAFFCTWLCNPQQANFTSVVAGPNVTFWVSSSLADAVYAPCKEACLPFGGGVRANVEYPTAIAFIQQFNSDNDPTYHVDPAHPHIVYEEGSAPNGSSISLGMFTIFNASGTDTGACPVLPTQANSPASMQWLSVPMFYSLILFLLFLIEN